MRATFRIGAIFLLFALQAFGEITGTEKPVMPRSIEALEADLDKNAEIIHEAGVGSREEERLKRAYLESWSLKEVKRFLDEFPQVYSSRWGELMVERWAFEEPDEWLDGYRARDEEFEELKEKAGQGLEANPAEAHLGFQWAIFEAGLSGWSRKEPVIVWEACKRPGGVMSGLSLLGNGFGYLAPITLMENFARVDPRSAWVDFGNLSTGRYCDLYRESMLKGISEGLSDDTNWQEALETAIDLAHPHLDQLRSIIRENLMARWLEHDPAAAEKWFRSPRADLIGYDEIEIRFESSFFRALAGPNLPGKLDVRKPASLSPAVALWLGRDFEGALNWVRDHPEMIPELFFEEDAGGGIWMAHRQARRMLVECLGRDDRERFLREVLARGSRYSSPLYLILEEDEHEEMMAAGRELEVTEEMVELLVRELVE